MLHLARPSLSEQIANLEAELGVALFVRTGRRLELTDAGRLLRPEAERTLAAASDAAHAVRRARTLTGGTASLGTFSTAHHLLLPGLVEDFVRRHPEVAVRVVGENSVQLADAVSAGRLEAALVALPIDDEGLEVSAPVAQFEVVYASSEPGRLDGAMTIERLAETVLVLPEARWGNDDPTRRQLAERSQRAGVTVTPRIEVQHANAALELAARGIADTVVTRALLDTLRYGDRLAAASLDPPLYEAFAFIRRRNSRPSPATRALMTLAEQHLAGLSRPVRSGATGRCRFRQTQRPAAWALPCSFSREAPRAGASLPALAAERHCGGLPSARGPARGAVSGTHSTWRCHNGAL